MTKTLRITTIIAVLLAAGLLVFPAVFGSRGGKSVEQFLKSPGVIDKFQTAKGKKSAAANQTSPLVTQAKAFALYLNPPAPKSPRQPSRPTARQQIAPRPQVTSPKFKLLGTSFYELHPDLSLALIDEPGKGIRWVRQSAKVGHLVIEQIKDGLVVAKDGSRTFEVAVADRPKKVNLVKSSTLDETPAETPTPPPQAEIISADSSETLAAEELGDEESSESALERAATLEAFISQLKAAQKEVEPNQPTTEERQANDEFRKFIESIQATRVSAEEAKNLDTLGKKLQNGEIEPNAADQSTKIQHSPRQKPPRPPRR